MEVTGAVKIKNLPDLACIKNFPDLLKALEKFLVLQIPDSITNVVVGVTEPTDEDSVWFKRNSSGSIIGICVFSGGDWTQIFPSPVQIFKQYGNSDTPPSGYALITVNTPGFSSADVAKLQSDWLRDPSDSFWTIYETIYTGQ